MIYSGSQDKYTAFRMKGKKSKIGAVTDEAGRVRFHGAFTGGFSAGYFNTVGSAEGFQPSTFRSSRTDRHQGTVQSIKDFMDEGDGLLGATLYAQQGVDTFKEEEAKFRELPKLVSDLVVVPIDTVGRKLMQQMGWKAGQGVGPRQRKKSDFVHPHVDVNVLPSSAIENGSITFAPSKSTMDFSIPPPKCEIYGVGYDMSKDNPELLVFQRHKPSEQLGKDVFRVSDLFDGGKGSSGPKHGAKGGLSSYVMEEEDFEVYEQGMGRGVKPSKDLYDMELGAEEEEEGAQQGRFGGSRNRNKEDVRGRAGGDRNPAEQYMDRHMKSTGTMSERCPSDSKPVLPGFTLSRRKQEKPSYYPAPEVPASVVTMHVFAKKGSSTSGSGRLSRFNQKYEANRTSAVDARAALLESNRQQVPQELKEGDSIYQLIKPEDQARLQSIIAAAKIKGAAAHTVEPTVTPSSSSSKQRDHEESRAPAARPMLVSASVLNSNFASLSHAFKNKFVSATVTGSSLQENIVKVGMATATEYSMEKTAMQPAVDVAAEEQARKKAEEEKARRKVSRTAKEWIPSSLLCKRFNIRPPESAAKATDYSLNKKPPMGEMSALDQMLMNAMELPIPTGTSSAGEEGGEGSDGAAVDWNIDRGNDSSTVSRTVFSSGPRLTEDQQEQRKIDADVYIAKATEKKPSIALFKSIFAESDSEEEEEEEEDGGDDEKEEEVKQFAKAATVMKEEAAAAAASSVSRVYTVAAEPQQPQAPPPLLPSVSIAQTEAVAEEPGSVPLYVPRSQRSQQQSGTADGSNGKTQFVARVGRAGMQQQRAKRPILSHEDADEEGGPVSGAPAATAASSSAVTGRQAKKVVITQEDDEGAARKRRKHASQSAGGVARKPGLSFD